MSCFQKFCLNYYLKYLYYSSLLVTALTYLQLFHGLFFYFFWKHTDQWMQQVHQYKHILLIINDMILKKEERQEWSLDLAAQQCEQDENVLKYIYFGHMGVCHLCLCVCVQIVRWAVDKNEMTLRYIFIYIYIYTNTHINVFKHLTKKNKLLSSTTVPSRTNCRSSNWAFALFPFFCCSECNPVEFFYYLNWKKNCAEFLG